MIRPHLPGKDWTTIDTLVREYSGVPTIRYVPVTAHFKLYVDMIDLPGFQYHGLNLELDGRQYLLGKYPSSPDGEGKAENDFKKYCKLLEQGRAEIQLSGNNAKIVALPKALPPKKKKNR